MVMAWHGVVWHGMAGHGKAWQGGEDQTILTT